MNIPRVRFLFLEEVVHSGLDVFAKGAGREPLGCERVLLPLCSTRLVAVITNKPGQKNN